MKFEKSAVTIFFAAIACSMLCVCRLFNSFSIHIENQLLNFAVSFPKLCWLLLWYAEDLIYFYLARFIGGCFGGSGYMIVRTIKLNIVSYLDVNLKNVSHYFLLGANISQ